MIQKLAIGIFATALSLVVAELLLILFSPSPPPTPPLYPGDIVVDDDRTLDPVLGWKLPPNAVLPEATDEFSVTYRANSSGFRGPELIRDPDRRRIVVLGDSYAFGTGVEQHQTFAHQLESTLSKTRVYNLAIGAYGIDQMWLALRTYGLRLDPQLVILVFVRPDLDRSLNTYRKDHVWRQKPSFRLVDGELQPLTVENRPSWLRRFASGTHVGGLWRKTESSLSRYFAVGYRWRLNRALFEQIKHDSSAANADLLIVHLPINSRNPTPMFSRDLGQRGFDFIDLADHLPEDATSLYYPQDRHLTVRGHQVVADILVEQLSQRNIH